MIVYHGLALKAAITLVLALAGIFYSLSYAIFPGSPRETLRLAWRLFLVALAFITLYFATTTISPASMLMKRAVLTPSSGYRSYLTDDTFLIFLPLALNNVLMGVVAWIRDEDFFATRHRRHLLLGLIPAALTLITMLPYEVLQLDHLYFYIITAAIGYVLAFAIGLQLEYGEEAV